MFFRRLPCRQRTANQTAPQTALPYYNAKPRLPQEGNDEAAAESAEFYGRKCSSKCSIHHFTVIFGTDCAAYTGSVRITLPSRTYVI